MPTVIATQNSINSPLSMDSLLLEEFNKLNISVDNINKKIQSTKGSLDEKLDKLSGIFNNLTTVKKIVVTPTAPSHINSFTPKNSPHPSTTAQRASQLFHGSGYLIPSHTPPECNLHPVNPLPNGIDYGPDEESTTSYHLISKELFIKTCPAIMLYPSDESSYPQFSKTDRVMVEDKIRLLKKKYTHKSNPYVYFLRIQSALLSSQVPYAKWSTFYKDILSSETKPPEPLVFERFMRKYPNPSFALLCRWYIGTFLNESPFVPTWQNLMDIEPAVGKLWGSFLHAFLMITWEMNFHHPITEHVLGAILWEKIELYDLSIFNLEPNDPKDYESLISKMFLKRNQPIKLNAKGKQVKADCEVVAGEFKKALANLTNKTETRLNNAEVNSNQLKSTTSLVDLNNEVVQGAMKTEESIDLPGLILLKGSIDNNPHKVLFGGGSVDLIKENIVMKYNLPVQDIKKKIVVFPSVKVTCRGIATVNLQLGSVKFKYTACIVPNDFMPFDMNITFLPRVGPTHINRSDGYFHIERPNKSVVKIETEELKGNYIFFCTPDSE